MEIHSDLEVRLVPEADVFKGREIVIAYTSPFGGAGIQLTPAQALSLADALRSQVAESLARETKRKGDGQ